MIRYAEMANMILPDTAFKGVVKFKNGVKKVMVFKNSKMDKRRKSNSLANKNKHDNKCLKTSFEKILLKS